METDSLDAFEAWWQDEVVSFAENNKLPLHYVEEEFIIDGELIKVDLTWDLNQFDNDLDKV